MRVLHIGKFFPPHAGGIERTSADLCRGLATKGVAVAMLAHAEPGTPRTTTEVVGDVDLTRVACLGQFLYAPMSPSFPLHLRRVIARFRPDILHLHMPNTSAFFALMLPSARRIPWVTHWHADIPLDSRHAGLRAAYRLYRPWERALLRQASAIIATSPDYAESSAAIASWRSKVHIVPLGIPDISATPRDTAKSILWPNAPLRVLAVGRLSYFKGFDVLLRAIADVPEAGLVLIGDGECAADLRRLAKTLNIESRVNFAGRIDMSPDGDAALAAAYSSADVFCLPSTERAESFGIVLLEAMRAGVATISSAIPGSGVNYVVRDGETGVMVAPGDPFALSSAIHRLRDDVELRHKFGAAGRRRFAEEFTLDASVNRTLALYQKVLDEDPRRATAAPAA
jgi:glycosyltransferase involved in cell wall biosynthesis